MTNTPRDLPITKAELDTYLSQQARELKLAARIETADRIRGRGREVAAEFRQLYREAKNELGADHELALRAEHGLIQAEAKRFGAGQTVPRLVELADRCARLLSEDHPTTRQIFASRAKFARYAGNTAWRTEYEDLIAQAELKHGVHSRLASIKRMNLAVGLMDWGQSETNRDEAYRIAAGEWKWRLEQYGEDNPFVYVAAANTLNIAVRSLQLNRPLLDSNQLLAQAVQVYEHRLRLLGSDHESTQNSFVTLHGIRAEMGSTDAPWLLLSIVTKEHDSQVAPTVPERLPIALSRAFTIVGDVEFAQEWMRTAKEVLEKTYGADAPRTIGAIQFLELGIVAAEAGTA